MRSWMESDNGQIVPKEFIRIFIVGWTGPSGPDATEAN